MDEHTDMLEHCLEEQSFFFFFFNPGATQSYTMLYIARWCHGCFSELGECTNVVGNSCLPLIIFLERVIVMS